MEVHAIFSVYAKKEFFELFSVKDGNRIEIKAESTCYNQNIINEGVVH
jgi:hypothetical protein